MWESSSHDVSRKKQISLFQNHSMARYYLRSSKKLCVLLSFPNSNISDIFLINNIVNRKWNINPHNKAATKFEFSGYSNGTNNIVDGNLMIEFDIFEDGFTCIDILIFGKSFPVTHKPLHLRNETNITNGLGNNFNHTLKPCRDEHFKNLLDGYWVKEKYMLPNCIMSDSSKEIDKSIFTDKTVVFMGDSLIVQLLNGFTHLIDPTDRNLPNWHHSDHRQNSHFLSYTTANTRTRIIWCGSIGMGEIGEDYHDFPSTSLQCLERVIKPECIVFNVFLFYTRMFKNVLTIMDKLSRYESDVDYFLSMLNKRVPATMKFFLYPSYIWQGKQSTWVPIAHCNYFSKLYADRVVRLMQTYKNGYIIDVFNVTKMRPDLSLSATDGIHYREDTMAKDYWAPLLLSAMSRK
jgi:hypothetical protein